MDPIKIQYLKSGNGGTENPTWNPKSAKTPILHTTSLLEQS